jgi:hypothetical protein
MLISAKVRISFTGEPKAQKLCHCTDCKKISGGSYSNNIIVAEGDFKLESGMLIDDILKCFLVIVYGRRALSMTDNVIHRQAKINQQDRRYRQ